MNPFLTLMNVSDYLARVVGGNPRNRNQALLDAFEIVKEAKQRLIADHKAWRASQ